MVTSGRARGIVIGTGTGTAIGKIRCDLVHSVFTLYIRYITFPLTLMMYTLKIIASHSLPYRSKNLFDHS